jgi:mannose/fructose/sorbose-specific phosphotransferase system IIA component
MINIVVVSHGNLAVELIKSAQMIGGNCDDIYAVTLFPEDTPESFGKKVDAVMDELGEQETLILIDIFCGTPYNVTSRQVLKDNVECVTGANLPMLVEAMLTREDISVSELAEQISNAGIESVKNLKPLLRHK